MTVREHAQKSCPVLWMRGTLWRNLGYLELMTIQPEVGKRDIPGAQSRFSGRRETILGAASVHSYLWLKNTHSTNRTLASVMSATYVNPYGHGGTHWPAPESESDLHRMDALDLDGGFRRTRKWLSSMDQSSLFIYVSLFT